MLCVITMFCLGLIIVRRLQRYLSDYLKLIFQLISDKVNILKVIQDVVYSISVTLFGQ
jgi:hypothetical protein